MKNHNENKNKRWKPDPDAGIKYLRKQKKKAKNGHVIGMRRKMKGKIITAEDIEMSVMKTAYNKVIRQRYRSISKKRLKWIKIQIKKGKTPEEVNRYFKIWEINVALWCLENRR